MNKTTAIIFLAAGLALGFTQSLRAQTDGTVSFRVTTLRTSANYDPKNVMAIWVTDGSGAFVKTLKKQAASRENYLYKWIASSSRNVTDAITGATLATQQTHQVTWNLRNAAGTLVPDGAYRVMVEMTTKNGQGPVTPATHVQFTKGASGVTVTPTNLPYLAGFSLTYTPSIAHDISITSLAPASGIAGATIPIAIAITNLQLSTESFSVVLSNTTSGVRIGTNAVIALGAKAGTIVTIPWNTAAIAAGAYTLKAVAGPVAGETTTANNTRTASITLAAPIRDVAVTAIQADSEATAGDVVDVPVAVANLGQLPQTFSVTLTDTTANRLLGTAPVTNLASGAARDLLFAWPTLGFAPGSHTLVATATATGDGTSANNSKSTTGVVGSTGFGLDEIGVAGSLGGFCSAVAAANGTIAAGLGSTLSLLEENGSGGFRPLGSLRLPGQIRAVAVSGSYLYTANGDKGVHLVNIATPSAPLLVACFNTSGHANGLAIAGQKLYIADGGAGVRILDISNPQAPVLIGAYQTEGPAVAVAVAGSTAYVVDEHVGLLVLNAGTPAAPVLQGSFKTGFGQSLAVSGTMACLTDANGKFFVINVGNPAAPVLSGSLTLGAPGKAVALSGSTAFVAAGSAGLVAVNIATPSAPTLLGSVVTPGPASGVALSGPYVYVADGFKGLRVVNVATPASPILTAAFSPGQRAVDVAIAGGRAYVASGEGGLSIYEVTNVAAPVLLGSSSAAGNARGIAVSGSLAAVADGQFGLRLFDVSNPAAPLERSLFVPPGLGAIRSVAIAGTTVLAADAYTVVRVDVSDPALPILKASYPAPGYVFDLALSGNLAAAAAGNAGLLLFDIAGAGQLTYLGRYDTPGLASAVEITGQTAYVADGRNGWLILNIANPASPQLASSFSGTAFGVAMDGSNASAMVVGGAESSLLNISAPLQPVQVGSITPLVNAMKAAAGGGYAFIAEDEAGVAIVRAMANDLDSDSMPDTWEQQIVDADPDDAIHSAADVSRNGDFDNDGMLNYQEYLAGTLATDAQSVFAVASSEMVPGAGFTVRWHSQPGKIYTVFKTADLQVGFTPLQTGIAATPPLNSFTDPDPGSSAFYMIGTSGP